MLDFGGGVVEGVVVAAVGERGWGSVWVTQNWRGKDVFAWSSPDMRM